MNFMRVFMLILWGSVLAPAEARASGVLIGPRSAPGDRGSRVPLTISSSAGTAGGFMSAIGLNWQGPNTFAIFSAPVAYDGLPSTKEVLAKAAKDGLTAYRGQQFS